MRTTVRALAMSAAVVLPLFPLTTPSQVLAQTRPRPDTMAAPPARPLTPEEWQAARREWLELRRLGLLGDSAPSYGWARVPAARGIAGPARRRPIIPGGVIPGHDGGDRGRFFHGPRFDRVPDGYPREHRFAGRFPERLDPGVYGLPGILDPLYWNGWISEYDPGFGYGPAYGWGPGYGSAFGSGLGSGYGYGQGYGYGYRPSWVPAQPLEMACADVTLRLATGARYRIAVALPSLGLADPRDLDLAIDARLSRGQSVILPGLDGRVLRIDPGTPLDDIEILPCTWGRPGN